MSEASTSNSDISSNIDLTATFARHACQTSGGKLAFDNKLSDDLSSKVMVDALTGKNEIGKAIADSGAKIPDCGPDKGIGTGFTMPKR